MLVVPHVTLNTARPSPLCPTRLDLDHNRLLHDSSCISREIIFYSDSCVHFLPCDSFNQIDMGNVSGVLRRVTSATQNKWRLDHSPSHLFPSLSL